VKIERLAYRWEFLVQMGGIGAVEKYRRGLRRLNRQKSDKQQEYRPNPNSEHAKRSQRWRQEFIERYHEEP